MRGAVGKVGIASQRDKTRECFRQGCEPVQAGVLGKLSAIHVVAPAGAVGGTGEPEVAALTTELEKGRCFNLVSGHNAAAIRNPGFAHLLCNGIQWADAAHAR